MKTTVNLPDALLDLAKQFASERGRTLTSMIEEGIRIVIANGEAERSTPAVNLPTFGEVGRQALVDLEDRDALWAALDAGA